MSTKYENYITGDDGNFTCDWSAQTFTPSISHIITSVILKLWKAWTPAGILTIGIRATDGDGKPTGSDLASGTTDGNTLPTTAATAEWREITLGAGTNLTAGIKYAIVVSCSISNTGQWRRDTTSATYAGGDMYTSADSGATWTFYQADQDCMFEEWGNLIAVGRSYGYIIG